MCGARPDSDATPLLQNAGLRQSVLAGQCASSVRTDIQTFADPASESKRTGKTIHVLRFRRTA